MTNTTNPKSITLKEFEELADSFVQNQSDDYDEVYASNRTLSKEFLLAFKSILFIEELEKESRRKEYEKAKEDYLKLKEEFEVSKENATEEGYLSIIIEGTVYRSKSEILNNSCMSCAFEKNYRDCDEATDSVGCSDNGIIWVKKQVY